jgi:hypothetical protein
MTPRGDLDGPSIPIRVEPIRLPAPAQTPPPAEQPDETPTEAPPVEEPVPS